MDDAALRSWVSDQLFALLGFAESALVELVIALGAPPNPCRATNAAAACSRRVQRSRSCSAPRMARAALQHGVARRSGLLGKRCLTSLLRRAGKKATNAGSLTTQLIEQARAGAAARPRRALSSAC
jgi:hypothetical protein